MDFITAGVAAAVATTAVATAVVSAARAAPKTEYIPPVDILDNTVLGVDIELVDDTTVSVNGRNHTVEMRGEVAVLVGPNGMDANSEIQRCYRAWLANTPTCFTTISHPFLSLVKHKRRLVSDRWGLAILSAIKSIGCYSGERSFQFRDLRSHMAMLFGADDPRQAAMGMCYHPYNGKLIDIRRHVCYIAFWIEERSGHSRQYYWRANRRVHWSEEERPLLFINPGLAAANNAIAWRPYSQVRGTGWYLNPTEAKRWYKEERPSDAVLAAADAVIDNPPPKRDGTIRRSRRGGMRGATHTKVGAVVSSTYFH
jgi:hypothetical protein